MATTTSFDDWLDYVNPENPPDLLALVDAIEGETTVAQFRCERAPNGQLIVYSHDAELQLRLATPAAKEGFLRALAGRYVEPGTDIIGWAAMHHLSSKDD